MGEGKILIVDDSDTCRLSLSYYLKASGYRNILSATNAKEALSILSQSHSNTQHAHVDLILMDIVMPEINGIEAVRMIKSNPAYKDIPIVMVSLKEEMDSLEKAFKAGAIDYLTKPVNKIELNVRIQSILRLKKEIELVKDREEKLKNEIIDRKEIQNQLARLVRHDPLTGLPNRIVFNDHLKQAMRRMSRSDKSLAIMIVDLDRFKLVNDTLGHPAGDQLLIQVAERMNTCVREIDTLARVGGDEFYIILENIEQNDTISRVAERIIQSMEKPFHLNGNEARIGCSIGITIFPNDGTDPDKLIRNADIALYKVKERGRNHYQFFTADMDQKIHEKIKLCYQLLSALEKGEFFLVFQPKLDIRTSEIIGVEALLRWRHPEGKEISPQTFIPLLEETGLIGQVNEWVLKEACAINLGWQQKGLPKITIAVNFSPLQFHDEHLADRVQSILASTGMAPQFLEVEITEGLFTVGDQLVGQTLAKLKDLGIHMIIMDDFGTGYSSLSYLKRFPIDAIKIDRVFVHGIMQNSNDAALVCAIAAMGLALDLKSIVAEGVEEETQIPFLRHMGCDSYQGFLFSQPISASEFELLLDKNETLLPTLKNKASVYTDTEKNNKRILVVEDYPTNLQVALKYIKNAGYQVFSASNGKEAVELFKTSGPYDLILMDLQMPIMDGYEATKEIRKLEKAHVPIISITAYDLKGVKERCIAAGMDDYLPKPFKRQTLMEMIEKWTSSAQ